MGIMEEGKELEQGGLLGVQQESQEKMLKEEKEGVSLKTNERYPPQKNPKTPTERSVRKRWKIFFGSGVKSWLQTWVRLVSEEG